MSKQRRLFKNGSTLVGNTQDWEREEWFDVWQAHTTSTTKIPKTSHSHPIDVDWFSQNVVLRGKLGMTFAPGKRHENGMTGVHRRDMQKDLTRLREEYSTHLLVTLMEREEMHKYGMESLFQELSAYAIRSLWFPIRDMSIPTSLDHTQRCVEKILGSLENKEHVVIHCRGGHGRTGLIAACVLVEFGLTPKEAIRATRTARSGTIHNTSQEDFVTLYKNEVVSSRTGTPL